MKTIGRKIIAGLKVMLITKYTASSNEPKKAPRNPVKPPPKKIDIKTIIKVKEITGKLHNIKSGMIFLPENCTRNDCVLIAHILDNRPLNSPVYLL